MVRVRFVGSLGSASCSNKATLFFSFAEGKGFVALQQRAPRQPGLWRAPSQPVPPGRSVPPAARRKPSRAPEIPLCLTEQHQQRQGLQSTSFPLKNCEESSFIRLPVQGTTMTSPQGPGL